MFLGVEKTPSYGVAYAVRVRKNEREDQVRQRAIDDARGQGLGIRGAQIDQDFTIRAPVRERNLRSARGARGRIDREEQGPTIAVILGDTNGPGPTRGRGPANDRRAKVNHLAANIRDLDQPRVRGPAHGRKRRKERARTVENDALDLAGNHEVTRAQPAAFFVAKRRQCSI